MIEMEHVIKCDLNCALRLIDRLREELETSERANSESLDREYELVKERDRLREQLDDAKTLVHEKVLVARGIVPYVDAVCPSCKGFGVRSYGSTATWHGGMGGQSITNDVCDKCWGSGIDGKPGVNLRGVTARIANLQMQLDASCNAEELRQCRAERDRLREENERLKSRNATCIGCTSDDCCRRMQIGPEKHNEEIIEALGEKAAQAGEGLK